MNNPYQSYLSMIWYSKHVWYIRNSYKNKKYLVYHGNELDRCYVTPEGNFVHRKEAETRWKFLGSRRNGASRNRVGDVCSVDAARHPPFSTDARASQGQARSNPPGKAWRRLDSSLTSRYSRPRAIKMLEDRSKRAVRAVSLFVLSSERLTLRDRPRCRMYYLMPCIFYLDPRAILGKALKKVMLGNRESFYTFILYRRV